MIRRAINITARIKGTFAVEGMHLGLALCGALFTSLEQPVDQPKQRDLDRAQQLN